MMELRTMSLAAATVLVLVPVSTPSRVAAQVRSGVTAAPPSDAAMVGQRAFNMARARRQPVTDLIADSFMEIQWHGGGLTRPEAIEHYQLYDDVSAETFSERQTVSFGDIAVISQRTDEEGTPYPSRRLYVWVREDTAEWRLLLFQRTFMFPKGAKLGPHLTPWPASDSASNARATEEAVLATRRPILAQTIATPDAIFINGHGERLTREQWAATLTGSPSDVRFLRRLYAGDATVFVGEEISPAAVFPRRFTHIWTRSPGGLQLRFSQTTYQALEDFNPDSKAQPITPQT